MKLIAAPAAQTHDSIAVVWEKPEQASQVIEYQLFFKRKRSGKGKRDGLHI